MGHGAALGHLYLQYLDELFHYFFSFSDSPMSTQLCKKKIDTMGLMKRRRSNVLSNGPRFFSKFYFLSSGISCISPNWSNLFMILFVGLNKGYVRKMLMYGYIERASSVICIVYRQ